MSPFFENIFLLLGTVIGAGIFSLPIALKQAGWIFFLIMIVGLELFLAKINSLYRDIVDNTKEKHQLPGYVRHILGERMSKVASVLLLFSTFGALLAYLIIGGTFTGNVFGVSSWSGSILFYVLVVFITVFAGKKIEAFDVIFTCIKVVLLFFIILTSFSRLTMFSMRFVPFIGENPLSAYGSILFALTGISIIPELKKDKHTHTAIYIAEFIVLLFYLLFSIALFPYLSTGKFIFKNILFDITGVFTILSPYLMLTWVGYDLLEKDLSVHKPKALLFVMGIPLVLFLFGLQSFMKVISLTGGVFLGSIALIITMMYQKKFPKKHTLSITVIQIVFIIGVILEFVQFLKP